MAHGGATTDYVKMRFKFSAITGRTRNWWNSLSGHQYLQVDMDAAGTPDNKALYAYAQLDMIYNAQYMAAPNLVDWKAIKERRHLAAWVEANFAAESPIIAKFLDKGKAPTFDGLDTPFKSLWGPDEVMAKSGAKIDGVAIEDPGQLQKLCARGKVMRSKAPQYRNAEATVILALTRGGQCTKQAIAKFQRNLQKNLEDDNAEVYGEELEWVYEWFMNADLKHRGWEQLFTLLREGVVGIERYNWVIDTAGYTNASLAEIIATVRRRHPHFRWDLVFKIYPESCKAWKKCYQWLQEHPYAKLAGIPQDVLPTTQMKDLGVVCLELGEACGMQSLAGYRGLENHECPLRMKWRTLARKYNTAMTNDQIKEDETSVLFDDAINPQTLDPDVMMPGEEYVKMKTKGDKY